MNQTLGQPLETELQTRPARPNAVIWGEFLFVLFFGVLIAVVLWIAAE